MLTAREIRKKYPMVGFRISAGDLARLDKRCEQLGVGRSFAVRDFVLTFLDVADLADAVSRAERVSKRKTK
jgi:hypothetical protein